MVTISAGETIYLDVTTADLDGIVVEGTLILTDCGVFTPELRSTWILVTGTLQAGSASEPIEDVARITLIDWPDATPNNPPTTIPPNNCSLPQELQEAMSPDRGLVVIGDGTLRLHGKPRDFSWTRLTANAASGSLTVDVEGAITNNWLINDRIVITSSDFDWEQAELRKISSMTGQQITLSKALDYTHHGTDYDAKPGTAGWKVEGRAEVGLLERNVIVRGKLAAGTSYANNYGHVIAVRHPCTNSQPTIDLAWSEFRDLGIEGKAGRYPLHLHQLGDYGSHANGPVIDNCSFLRGYNHWAVIHDISYATLTNNVAYRGVSHGFYLQGTTDNVNVHNNLGIGAYAPQPANYPQGSYPEAGNEHLLDPAVFYFEDSDNSFRDNIAAGAERYGYWLDLQNTADPTIDPNTIDFTGNVAHSNGHIGFYQDARPTCSGFSTTTPTISDFLTWKNRRYGLWFRTYGRAHFNDIKISDSRAGFYIASDGYLIDLFNITDGRRSHVSLGNCLVIGETDNKGIGFTNYQMGANGAYPYRDRPIHEQEAGRSLPQYTSHHVDDNGVPHANPWDALVGFELYDGFVW